MIPITLEFEAFGPFADKQQIDFTKFDNDRLFLISGQTGSGKTTIFDAITLALFGEASGSTRQADSFKSQFADESAICYIRFDFFLKGKKYSVHREPIQMRVRRNQNISRSNSIAELTLENGDIISGTDAVDKYILELLGINADQFKKIVMLPQGEFKRFLSDDINEKQKILRKIFGTEILDRFTEQLRLNTIELKSKLDTVITQYETHIGGIAWIDNNIDKQQAIDCKTDIGLLISILDNHNNQIAETIKAQKSELTSLQAKKYSLNLAYHVDLNRKFESYSQTLNEFEKLTQKSEEFNSIKDTIARLSVVKELSHDYYKLIADNNQLTTVKEQLISTEKALRIVDDNLKCIQLNQEKINQLKAEIPTLIKQSEHIKQQQIIYREIQHISEEISTLEHSKSTILDNISAVTAFRLYAETAKLLQAENEHINKINQLEATQNSHTSLCIKFDNIKQKYQNQFNDFINNQAAFLSSTLKHDMPCPVCGSTTHPSPAVIVINQITQEILDQSKQQYELITSQVEASKATLEQLQSSIIDTDLKMHTDKKNSLQLQLNSIKLRDDMVAISPIPSLESIEKKISDLEKNLAIINQNIQSKQLQNISLNQKLSTDYSDKALTDIERKINDINTQCDSHAQALQSTLLENERLNETYQQLSIRANELTASTQLLKSSLYQSLENKNISTSQFNSDLQRINELDILRKSLEDYNNQLAIKSALLEELQKELNGKSPINIDELQAESDLIEQDISDRNKSYIDICSKYNSNCEIKKRLSTLAIEYQKLETEYTNVNKLFEVANGKYSDRMNLERYVLASYFNSIIEFANLRLDLMTSSRYTLIRRSEKEKGNKASGLALDVFDAHTGKTRHVNTLSGGETFKVSLALSLGLADIISQGSGGIELNTMFIDEGFGTLDSKSLDSAIECLSMLRESGRYIGIISHVSELKEMISQKIFVVQQPNGSQIKLSVDI